MMQTNCWPKPGGRFVWRFFTSLRFLWYVRYMPRVVLVGVTRGSSMPRVHTPEIQVFYQREYIPSASTAACGKSLIVR